MTRQIAGLFRSGVAAAFVVVLFTLAAAHSAFAQGFTKEQIKVIQPEWCDIACRGCGCKGGPGYRSPPDRYGKRGHWLSYKTLIKVCGEAPHAGKDPEKPCIFEGSTVVAGCTKPVIPDKDVAIQLVKAADEAAAEEKIKKKREKKQRKNVPVEPAALPVETVSHPQ